MPQPKSAASITPNTTVTSSDSTASHMARTVWFWLGALARQTSTAATNATNPAASASAPALSNHRSPNRKPAASASVPRPTPAQVTAAVSRGRGTGEPCSTGSICIIAPIMTMAMNPSVTRCVIAMVAGDSRAASASGPRHSRAAAASSRKAGATRKNRNGTDMGGACSSCRPA